MYNGEEQMCTTGAAKKIGEIPQTLNELQHAADLVSIVLQELEGILEPVCHSVPKTESSGMDVPDTLPKDTDVARLIQYEIDRIKAFSRRISALNKRIEL